MSAEKLANRYANAFFDEVVSHQKLENANQDLNFVSNAIASNKEFSNFIKNPIIEARKKLDVLKELFNNKIDSSTLSFLELLVQNKREIFLPLIIKKFINRYNDKNGITEVNVTVASELDQATQARIEDYVKKQSGKPNVKINLNVDETILGGFVIDFGDKILDNSIKYKLNKVKQELLTN